MIVQFIGSRSHIKQEIDYYRLITDAIKESNYELTYDWVEDAYKASLAGGDDGDDSDWQRIDQRFESAMQKADVVIVDSTLRGFFVGYRASQAVSQKKPLLLLTRDTTDSAVAGLNTPTGYLTSVTYNKENLQSIVRNFLDENIIDTKDLRFNFFLDRRAYNYLRWVSTKTGKTKAEVVRSLLQKEMEKDN